MYNFKKFDESQDGSHFFVKTPNDVLIRVSLFKPNEDYLSEYLEEKVRHLLISNSCNEKLTHEEAKGIFDTIALIVSEYLAYNECVVKIEVNPNCGKSFRIRKMLDMKHDDVKVFIKENEEECSAYYLYNRLKIEGTELLSELVDEYGS